MISQKDVISCISKALKVPSKKIKITSSDKDIEQWDSLGHLNILINLDEKLKDGSDELLMPMPFVMS